jgi:hypothetical protein
MLWRALSAIIVLFWAVMTGLLIRDTYFPDHSRFAEVPVRHVLDLFLTEAAAFNNTLHLLHGQEKIGHASFTIRKVSDESVAVPEYAVLIHGVVDVPSEEGKVKANFMLAGELEAAEKWKRIEAEVSAAAAQMEAKMSWAAGDRLPQIEVKKAGQVVMNTAMAEAMMKLPDVPGGKSDLLAKLMPGLSLNAEQASMLRFQAREGVMDLAGKRRRCFIVTLAAMQGLEVKVFFTEIGELARIELPQNYRLIEPMMHGLEPGLNTLE